jgi:biopolymer transport protein ExbB/TolQ
MAMAVTSAELRKGLGSLGTIATTSPFIGLFGTVFGIINAFHGIATAGSGGLAAVSAGIAEALITTGVGIGVAIIAVVLFNYFTERLERFQVEMTNASSELIDFIVKRHGHVG